DLFVAWEAGACVYAMSPIELLAPTGFVNKNKLTVWFSVPSVAAHIRKRNLLGPNALPTLRWSLFCGEPLPRATVEEWQGGGAKFLNRKPVRTNRANHKLHRASLGSEDLSRSVYK